MQEGIAVVKVNNIEVGSMPISQYEEIVRAVNNDWRTRIASVFSYVRFVWKFIIKLWSYFVQCFSVLFAMFMLYSLFHTAEITQFIDEMRSLPSESIANGIVSLTQLSVLVTFIGCFLSFLIKGTPVFVSASEDAINKKIREVMEVPAEGQVSVILNKDGVHGV
ncbi:hypothetical protein G718_04946 [Escherichia coli HVH 43 (4-2173468)]|uniref:hypothetical protein n=1 Tax=Escherichia coli TaxID=562 RepID=UPI00038FB418|nr:hypothetical protein [Escherichia coli]EQO56125.1 hypothetical protein G718_04946 [Escherichia coli HVH 43 (4-2173468)]KZO65366.1 hypothetical protein AAW07_21860 [Escherichia coli]